MQSKKYCHHKSKRNKNCIDPLKFCVCFFSIIASLPFDLLNVTDFLDLVCHVAQYFCCLNAAVFCVYSTLYRCGFCFPSSPDFFKKCFFVSFFFKLFRRFVAKAIFWHEPISCFWLQ